MTGSLVGMQLGKYQIRAEIGKGGMGVVYQSSDPLLDQEKAIKVLAPHLVWEPGFVERFLREARSAARLEHTHKKLIDAFGWYRRQVKFARSHHGRRARFVVVQGTTRSDVANLTNPPAVQKGPATLDVETDE